ncbi:MAG: nucleoside triphosphate pyrophosphohydrolase [Neomegalonema sp.]|nr:nucleoside triphosphate pyrophosphohydrolase [Neomegalonema sp.]
MKSQRLQQSDARLREDATTAEAGLSRLTEIMQRLRDPDGGCPWDVVQTHTSIAPYAIDEAYEVVDAIERNDMPDLCEELGDLQLQVVYHAEMAAERGDFDLTDVMRAVCEKMIRRHPHVFGDAKEAPDWESIKAEERRLKAAQRPKDEPAPQSALDGAPVTLPALDKAVELQKRAAKVGFDWPDIEPVLAKVAEESAELAEARRELAALEAQADRAERAAKRDAVTEEFGDLLFVMANLARWMKIDPEEALRRANLKFERRFRAVEASLAAEGKRPEQVDLAEMDRHWDAEKARERARKQATAGE